MSTPTQAGPKQSYEIHFADQDLRVKVDPEQLPDGHDGRPGSILHIALDAGVMIDHACGGVAACSTCHVYVREGLDSCAEPSEEEDDQLDLAPGLEPDSRLSCQCIPDGSSNVTIEIPRWNRNRVQTEH